MKLCEANCGERTCEAALGDLLHAEFVNPGVKHVAGSGCGIASPPPLGGLVTNTRLCTIRGSCLVPAVTFLVAPGLVKSLHALPASLHLVLALVLCSAAGPLATHRVGRSGIGRILLLGTAVFG